MPSKKNTNKEVRGPNDQKINWTQKSRHKTYESADAHRNKLKEGGTEHVKVKRCGAGGTEFKVSIGVPLAKKNSKSKKIKGEKTDESK
jgi:hypothetical protein